MPAVFALAGLEVTVIGPRGLAITASRHVREHIATGGSPASVREAMEAHVAENPEGYARVVVVDEPLLREFVECPASPRLAALSSFLSDASRLRRMLSKIDFMQDAVHHGVPVPAFQVVSSPEELKDRNPFDQPFVVKSEFSMSGSGVHIIRNDSDLERALPKLAGPLLIQEYLAGPVGSTAVLFRNGRPACWFSYYLRRNWPHVVAASSAIEICSLPEIENILRKVGSTRQLHGLCGIDWIVDANTGKPLVLELNPRPVPGLLAAGRAGVSFPEAIADLLEDGTAVQSPASVSPPLYRLFPQHLLWAIDERRPWEFVRTFANAPWRDPKLLVCTLRRVVTHYWPAWLRDGLKRLTRGHTNTLAAAPAAGK